MKFTLLRKIPVMLVLIIAIAIPAYALTGSGTSSSPYQVATFEDLLQVAENPTAYYEQVADIAINDVNLFEISDGVVVSASDVAEEWTPFNFSGNYNGNDKYITGLFVSDDNAFGGLFKTLDGATVRNLRLDFALVESDECAGILAAEAVNGTEIYGVVVSGSVIGKTTKAMNTAGGIVGRLGKDSLIEESASYANVSGATSYSANIGGIAGINEGSVYASSSAAKVFGTATYYDAAIGGIAGYNSGDIEESINQGTVGGESTALVNDCYVGGIAGVNKGNILYTINYGSVSNKNYSSGDSICAAGGISGIAIDSSIEESTNEGKVSGEYAYCGGISGVAVSDSDSHYLYYCDNLGQVSSAYGVAGGIVGRAVAAGEGYVSTKLHVSYCYNEGTLSGNAKGSMCGEIATVESAKVLVNELDSSNNNSAYAVTTTKILADEYQYTDSVTSTLSGASGTAEIIPTSEPNKWIIRYNVTDAFVPAPVLVTLTKIEDASKVSILSVDISKLGLSGTKLSGSVTLRVYLPEDVSSARAVVGLSIGSKYAGTKFSTVDTTNGRIDEITIPVDFETTAQGGAIKANVLIVSDENTMDPLCENKIVTK